MRALHKSLVMPLCTLGFAVLSAAVTSCGSSNGTGSTKGAGGTGAGAGGHSASGTGTGGMHDGGTGNGGGLTGCFTNSDCHGGICVGGSCCPSAGDVCGSECCTGAAVCLNGGCVKPGKDCYTAADCGENEYCETALGTHPDGGAPDAGPIPDGGAPDGAPDDGGGPGADGGAVCTQAPPLAGKCLPLPPVCPGDAGAPPDAGCVADCEYHPPPGMLNAVPRWTWGPNETTHSNYVDVWATPTVGRVHDTNCDGKIDSLDVPVVVFVSGKGIDANTGLGACCQCTNTTPTGCHTGVLRMLDGSTGAEIWSLANVAGSEGFAGTSIAIGDVDGDGKMDIVAVTGEGYIVMLDGDGNQKRISDKPIPGASSNDSFGWGGGLAIADMDGDGFPEIAFGATVYTTKNNAITLEFTGSKAIGGGGIQQALSTFVDLDLAPDNHLELLAGATAYKADGSILWDRTVAGDAGPTLPDGFPGVGDFNQDGKPDVVLVGNGQVWILDGLDGSTLLGPVTLPTMNGGSGGPPTVADFDGDGKPEIGVAMSDFYSMLKPDFANKTIDVVWHTPNHDYSSSVTGSTVFDFEGAGKASVIYGDECFLWVFDGATGAVRFATSHTSFTGTEASLVADVDGDGRAEIIMVSNSADPSNNGWKCEDASGTPVTVNGVTWTPGTQVNKSYRGIVAFGDAAHAWVGTRTLWSEHTYHVSNICDDTDSACDAPNVYGSIPKVEKQNWKVKWLNNFRQNVQDKGIFNAPDAVVSLTVTCSNPAHAVAAVRNIGLASLPSGVNVIVYKGSVAPANQVGTATTTHTLLPGQTEQMTVVIPASMGSDKDTYVAQIDNDPTMPTFHECNPDNDTSAPATAHCTQ